MKARHKRFVFLIFGMVALAIAAVLIFNALGSNLSYFYTPTEISQGKAPKDHVFRLGGLVKKGSVERGKELTIRFSVTDEKQDIQVEYTGILPDLFTVPPEVADALEKGHQEGVAAMSKEAGK
jgi:cytochrome c-type biogenesis protein CcmE